MKEALYTEDVECHQTDEKMLSLFRNWGSAIPMRHHLHSPPEGHQYLKRPPVISVDEDMAQLEPTNVTRGNVNRYENLGKLPGGMTQQFRVWVLP